MKERKGSLCATFVQNYITRDETSPSTCILTQASIMSCSHLALTPPINTFPSHYERRDLTEHIMTCIPTQASILSCSHLALTPLTPSFHSGIDDYRGW